MSDMSDIDAAPSADRVVPSQSGTAVGAINLVDCGVERDARSTPFFVPRRRPGPRRNAIEARWSIA
ncbi:hypothetical protein AV944_15035 [Sphingomonas sp. LK11]|nr:hypothetical protein AV944_15035 [Sphingomonas sp. LK11]